jgi:uncharacterized Zn finger protein
MPKENRRMSRFADLTWDDLNAWAGSKIVSRGRSYQQQGRVAELAHTEDGALVAWVDGTERYVTKVDTGADGTPTSTCSCPYGRNCKHGIAVVLEYLERVAHDRSVAQAAGDDERLALLAGESWDVETGDSDTAATPAPPPDKAIDALLKGKTKAQLIGLIHELAEQYPVIAQALADRRQLGAGDAKTLMTRLRKEIRDLGAEPAWRDYWQGRGHTPDYSGVRNQLEVLLKAGYADEVLIVGQELLTVGARQVEEGDDDGETAMEVADCMPVIVEALDRSSLDPAERLTWALDAVLGDDYDICEAFVDYLRRPHPNAAWQTLAEQLLAHLRDPGSAAGAGDFSRDYARDQLSDWAIHALEHAGREDEVIPLCEAEAAKTHSYGRLVERLVAARRYDDAERWILEGILTTNEKWPGIATGLRTQLLQIRTLQEDWPAAAAIQAEEFVRQPSRKAFTNSRGACTKVNAWPKVRGSLLAYLEKGVLPWQHEGWPLPETGLDAPAAEQRGSFPKVNLLIGIAILEKKPDQVLHWYDRLAQQRFGRPGVEEDEIATAVQTYAPDRAVAIWQAKAEQLIAQVKPSAYQEAAKYLRKAGVVMARQERKEQWDAYLRNLRQTHARKRRLIEILDGLDGKPIVSRRR